MPIGENFNLTKFLCYENLGELGGAISICISMNFGEYSDHFLKINVLWIGEFENLKMWIGE